MYKILILAYLIGQSPIETQQTFQMGQTFNTMEECKAELLKKDPVRDTYDVLWEFVNDMNFISIKQTFGSMTSQSSHNATTSVYNFHYPITTTSFPVGFFLMKSL